MTRILRAICILALSLTPGLLGPPQAVGQGGTIELGGFLAGLPPAGLTLPVGVTTTAQIDVPIDRGAATLSISFDVTSTTVSKLANGLIQNDHLVEVSLIIQGGKLVASAISEPATVGLPGILADVPGGSVTLPLAAEQTATLQLCGSSASPLPIVLGPLIEPDTSLTLNDGMTVEVDLVIAAGRLVVVEVSSLAPATPLCK